MASLRSHGRQPRHLALCAQCSRGVPAVLSLVVSPRFLRRLGKSPLASVKLCHTSVTEIL